MQYIDKFVNNVRGGSFFLWAYPSIDGALREKW